MPRRYNEQQEREQFVTDLNAYLHDCSDPVAMAFCATDQTREQFTTLVMTKYRKIKQRMPRRDKIELAVRRAKREIGQKAASVVKQAALSLLGLNIQAVLSNVTKPELGTTSSATQQRVYVTPVDPKYRTQH